MPSAKPVELHVCITGVAYKEKRNRDAVKLIIGLLSSQRAVPVAGARTAKTTAQSMQRAIRPIQGASDHAYTAQQLRDTHMNTGIHGNKVDIEASHNFTRGSTVTHGDRLSSAEHASRSTRRRQQSSAEQFKMPAEQTETGATRTGERRRHRALSVPKTTMQAKHCSRPDARRSRAPPYTCYKDNVQ